MHGINHYRKTGLCGFLTLIVFFLFLVGSTSAVAEEISVTYRFERPQITDITINGAVYQQLDMPNAPDGGNIGEPALPARGAYILIPYGSKIEEVKISKGEKYSLGSGFNVVPVGEPFRLSATPEEIKAPSPNPEIYSSSDPFPARIEHNVGTFGFRGYRIQVLKLRPVEYIPITGELNYYAELTVKITLAEDNDVNPLYRGLTEDYEAVMDMIDNRDALYSYDNAPGNGSRSYDMMILTTPELAPAFQDLKDYHDSTGIVTEIHTTDEISLFAPIGIRDFIRDSYLADGFQYLLIGADDDLIPALDLYVQSSDSDDPYVEVDMPGDIYYACLDGTYNYDGDTHWGEPTDGEGGGDVDLIAELFVGRIPVNTIAETNQYITKMFQYLNSEDPYLNKVLLAGENLRFGGLGEYGSYSLEEYIDGTDEHGYSTVGFPSAMFEIDSLYDRDYALNDWPKTEITTRMNNGVHFINHYGHCNEFWALKMYYADIVTMVSNSDLNFIYTQGCRAGHFDGLDCWAEYATVMVPHGSVAVIMNARYGFGAYDTDGPSQRFNREFVDAIFNPAENMPELGRANQDSKEDNLYRIDEPCMRWCYYQLHVFGDPTLKLRIDPGLIFSYPNGVPETVAPGERASFDLAVQGTCGGTPIEGSGLLHYSLNGGEYLAEPLTEISSNNYIVELPALDCGDTFEYYLSAQESGNGDFYHPSPATPNQVQVVDEFITIFEDDFETDLGWTISGGQWERGVPAGLGGDDQQYPNPDPESGCVGPNVMGYNLEGDYLDNIPEYHVTSAPVDCSAYSNIHLKFYRWLGIEGQNRDHACLRISTDGTNWTKIWENTCCINDNVWMEVDYDISEFVDGEPTVYIRFTMGSTNGGMRYCGWNIDDVRLVSYECSTYLCGDSNGDETVNVSDAVHIINYVFVGGNPPDPMESGDCNCDGSCNVSDAVWIINYVFVGGNDPCDTDGNEEPDC